MKIRFGRYEGEAGEPLRLVETVESEIGVDGELDPPVPLVAGVWRAQGAIPDVSVEYRAGPRESTEEAERAVPDESSHR